MVLPGWVEFALSAPQDEHYTPQKLQDRSGRELLPGSSSLGSLPQSTGVGARGEVRHWDVFLKKNIPGKRTTPRSEHASPQHTVAWPTLKSVLQLQALQKLLPEDILRSKPRSANCAQMNDFFYCKAKWCCSHLGLPSFCIWALLSCG